jgi:hypothetical protein
VLGLRPRKAGGLRSLRSQPGLSWPRLRKAYGVAGALFVRFTPPPAQGSGQALSSILVAFYMGQGARLQRF